MTGAWWIQVLTQKPACNTCATATMNRQRHSFLTIDPLQAITQESYTYGADSPLDLEDPSGLSVCLFGYCLGWHPVNIPEAEADFFAGFANAVTSTVTFGLVTIPQPYCGTGLNVSYHIGQIDASAEAAVLTGTKVEQALVKAGAGPLWSPIAAGMAAGGVQTAVAHDGNESLLQEDEGILGGGIGGVGGNATGSLVYAPSRAAAAGAGGLLFSSATSALLPW